MNKKGLDRLRGYGLAYDGKKECFGTYGEKCIKSGEAETCHEFTLCFLASGNMKERDARDKGMENEEKTPLEVM